MECDAQRPTNLPDLPLELLLLISEHLSLVDVACLSLCNHDLMECFASRAEHSFTQYIPNTRGPEDERRIVFLTSLSRDLPQYYLCYSCLRLHPWRSVALPKPWFDPRQCFKSMDDKYWPLTRPLTLDHFPTYTFLEIHFIHLQLVMRRFYYGPQFGISPESLFYIEVAVHDPDPLFKTSAEPVTSLMSIEARIYPTAPSLCLRIQELAAVKQHNVWGLFPEVEPMSICGNMGPHRFSNVVKAHIESYCSSGQASTRPADYGRCPECNTSYKLELRELDQANICLVVTRWLDLGPGLNPNDVRWKTHVDYSCGLNGHAHELIDSRQRFENDSVQAADSFSEEAAYRRNVSLLQDQKYRRAMTPITTQKWVMRPEMQ